MTTRVKLIKSLKERVKVELKPQSHVRFLQTVDPEVYFDTVVSTLYLYTRKKRGSDIASFPLAEIVCAIGRAVMRQLQQKKDSGVAAKTGGFLLWTFEEAGIARVTLGGGTSGHQTYLVEVTNDEKLVSLWGNVERVGFEKLPSKVPHEPWTSSKHACGANLVKTDCKEVLRELTPETHPHVFSCVNKAQAVGWLVNKPVYQIYNWALRNKTDAFADVWEAQNAEAKATKVREVRAIGEIAKKFLDTTFYHLYTYDFRGRKYPSTAYLHEQGADPAKGLLYRADMKPMGTVGFSWLLISIASNWGGDAGRPDKLKTDKIPLQDRVEWALANEDLFLAYADGPKVNQDWMKADKPWQFLAACMELRKLRLWQYERGDWNDYEMPSGLECYIDGSNNGAQHLSALTRDEITAPHVNLVPQAFPGDLYLYVGEHVWQMLEQRVADMPYQLVLDCENFIDELTVLKQAIQQAAVKSAGRVELVEQIRAFKKANEQIIDVAAPVYWCRFRDSKYRRKIVKRNVMTLPYGGTSYGLGQQQIDDARKHGIELLLWMEHRWGSFLGRAVFEDCKRSLERPMRLLTVFEAAGKLAEAEGRYLSWKVPVTDFPVVQQYTEGRVKKVWVQYGPPKGAKLSTGAFENTFQLNICFVEDKVQSKGKQAQGASPNAIHSLDAAHLMMTVHKADFVVTTVHDSYGCLLADMSSLFTLVREAFVELYEADPLRSLIEQIGGDLSQIEIGNLDVKLILESEYAFA